MLNGQYTSTAGSAVIVVAKVGCIWSSWGALVALIVI